MIDKNFWRCSLCSFNGNFGVVDTIGQHVRGGQHLKAKKNLAAGGISSSQLTIQSSFSKGIMSGMAVYPPSYVPRPSDMPRDILHSYCEKHICHGFHNYRVLVGEEMVDVRPLLNDLNCGKEWYPDPNYTRTILSSSNEIIHIEGTFRHRDCDVIFCNKCSLIPSYQDFRKRADRLRSVTIPRGERKCEQGPTLGVLQRNELIDYCRQWKNRCHDATDQVYLLNVALARATKSTDYFSTKLQLVLSEGSLPEIAELFRRACDSGAFQERPVLYKLLLDVVSNLLSVHRNGGRGNGKRYHPSTIQVFEVLQNFGGSAAHNFLSKNVLGPALNTTRSNFRENGFMYSIGINEPTFVYISQVLKSCKDKLGISGAIPFECAEDETKCVELATWNRRGDNIDGFCGFKISSDHQAHECMFAMTPSASTWDTIKDAFESLQVGTMCRVLVANPLVVGMPRLVYCLFSTCNQFDHLAVKRQWELIRKFHKMHLEDSVGPLRGHASDGDSRRRKLMLDSISRGTYGLKVDGFLMCAEVVDEAPLIMMQDPLHVGKKLRNPLLSATRVVFWGKYVASKNHLLLVLQKFNKDEHGLLEEDVNVKDKQNFPAVQRIAFPKVRKCLEQLDAGLQGEGFNCQEHVKGTILHLEVIWAFLEVFYGRGSLLDRVKLSSFVVHMIYFGTEYIRHSRHGHYLKDNWLTRESITDCLISCHSAVLHMMMMRDLFPHLPVALHKLGSDCCEDFFSLLGMHVKNKHNFCIGEAVERTSHIERTEQIKYDEDGPLFQESRRRKNLWWEGNPTSGKYNLQDYVSISNDALGEAWLSGFRLAQERACYVEMKDVLLANGKWTKPWPSSFTDSLNIIDRCGMDADDDSLDSPSPVLATTSSELDSNDSMDQVSEIDVLLRTSVLDVSQQGDVMCSSVVDSDDVLSHLKVCPTVHVPGKGDVFKMRLISELNTHPASKLPLDRLIRVQYRTSTDSSYLSNNAHDLQEVGLFDDVGVLMEEGKNLVWYLGRVQKMVKQHEKGAAVDYVRPVPLNEPGIQILLKYYKHIKGLEYSYGGYGGYEADFIKLEHVIRLVPMSINADSGTYLLGQEDKKTLDDYVKTEQWRRKNGGRRTTTSLTSTQHSRSLVSTPKQQAPVQLEAAQISHVTRSGRRATRLVNC